MFLSTGTTSGFITGIKEAATLIRWERVETHAHIRAMLVNIRSITRHRCRVTTNKSTEPNWKHFNFAGLDLNSSLPISLPSFTA